MIVGMERRRAPARSLAWLVCLVATALMTPPDAAARSRKPARKAAAPASPPADPAADAAAWRAAALLGPPHQTVLPRLVGPFKLETRYTPAGAAAGPAHALPPGFGTADARTVLGGRYVQVDVRAEVAGLPYEALLLVGYDNAKARYTLSLADTASTMRLELEGTCADPCNALEFTGAYTDPRTKRDRKMRATWRLSTEGASVLEVFDAHGVGDLAQTMTWEFTRP